MASLVMKVRNYRLVPASPTTQATRRRSSSENGATAVEYSLALVFIAAVIIATVAFLGARTNDNFKCAGKTVQKQAARCR